MKKIIIFIIAILVLLFLSDKVYKIYRQNYLLNSDAVVNVYFTVPEEDIDAYFNLEESTFNKDEHLVLCSLKKRDAYLLDYYHNLPIYSNLIAVDYNESFSLEKHLRFNKKDIGNYSTLIARLINKKFTNSYSANLSKSIVGQKFEKININFGKINHIVVDRNGTSPYCK